MHITSCIKLSHGRINDGKSGIASFPSLHMMFIVIPFDLVKFFLERFTLKNFGEMMGYICIKLPPMYLVDDIVLNSKNISNSMINLPDRNGGKMIVGREAGCWDDRSVPGFIIFCKLFDLG